MEFVPFSATTRMSGVNAGALQLRKGAGDAVAAWVREQGGDDAGRIWRRRSSAIAREGGTPLVVAENGRTGGRRACSA